MINGNIQVKHICQENNTKLGHVYCLITRLSSMTHQNLQNELLDFYNNDIVSSYNTKNTLLSLLTIDIEIFITYQKLRPVVF